nr:pyruvate kinase, cytosolic isozyme [Tanacetum cinerariifolium]
MCEKLLRAGMNVARFNFSHGTHDYHQETLNNLNIAMQNTQILCAVMLDTRGPEIRTGFLKDEKLVQLKEGREITISTDYTIKGNKEMISMSYKKLPVDLKPGNTILYADGTITLTVLSCDVDLGTVKCRCENTAMLENGGENPTVEQVRKRAKWDNDDYVYRCLILNGMFDSLFDIYQNVKTSKELWDTLEAKYMAEDALSKKFLVSNFINYKMTDSRLVLEQYNELLGIIGSHMRIKESLRVQDSDKTKGNNVVSPSVVNIVEHNNSFRLNIMSDNIGSAFMSTSKLNDSILWHARLGHVHFKSMQDMSKDGLIPVIDMDTEKCKTCMLNKIIKKPFHNVKRETKVLESIHSDLCDLHATLSLGNKKYFLTFIDDASRFYVVESNDSVAINSIIESKEVMFDEQKFSSVSKSSQRSLVKGTEDSGGSIVSKRVTNEIVQQSELQTSGLQMDLQKKVEGRWNCQKVQRRLVIQGFKQKSGIDYFYTYALMARISTIRLLIAMASIHNLIIHQMNIKIAFLNEELEEEVDLTKEFLSSRFSMKDIGEADVILGIRIKRESNVSTPLDTCENLMPNKGLAVSQLEYSRVIGYLMYAMTCTRPDIAFVVAKLSRYTSNPRTQHRQAIQRVLKYLKKTMEYRLVYSSYPSVLEATGKEAEWLKNLLLEIPLWVKPMAPISINCDSAATLAKAYSQIYNGKSRHLGVRHSMIRELFTNGVVSIEFVRSQQNLADHLMKGLARDLVIKSAKWMGLKYK